MKTIIVTGSNTGIGKEAARILAADGHRVLMLSRDSDKSRRAADEIRAATGNDEVRLFPVDLLRAFGEHVGTAMAQRDVAGLVGPCRQADADRPWRGQACPRPRFTGSSGAPRARRS